MTGKTLVRRDSSPVTGMGTFGGFGGTFNRMVHEMDRMFDDLLPTPFRPRTREHRGRH